MILAQTASSGFEIWIAPLATVIGIAANAVLIWGANKTQKREITFTGIPVDKKEFDKHVEENKRDHENIFSKIGGAERGVEHRINVRLDKFEADSKESRRGMHAEITNLTKEVSGLQTSAELTNQRIVQIDCKIDRLIEKEKHR